MSDLKPIFTEVNENFASGMKRGSAEGKGAYELISPLAMRRLAKLLQYGATNYGSRNWELGSQQSRIMQSAIRHLMNHLEGMRDEDHLAAALFNVQALIHQDEQIKRGNLPKELDDLPDYTIKPKPPLESKL